MELRIGVHEAERRGDILILRVRGEFTLADAHEYIPIRNRIGAELRYLLMLVNVKNATGMAPAVRRLIAESPTPHDSVNSAIAVVGAGSILRALFQLLFSAISLIGKRPVFPGFFGSETEALTFLDEQRERIHKQLARN